VKANIFVVFLGSSCRETAKSALKEKPSCWSQPDQQGSNRKKEDSGRLKMGGAAGRLLSATKAYRIGELVIGMPPPATRL
jgi:hypothetical protein